MCEVTANVHSFLGGGDENVLKLDSDDNFTTLCIY